MITRMRVLPGTHRPLGATFDGSGVNFAVFSRHAEAIDLCLFDPRGVEISRTPLPDKTDDIFHGYVRGLEPGQRYGYRAHGIYAPELGLRFNPRKLLVDPYARALDGEVDTLGPVFGGLQDDPTDRRPCGLDSAGAMPKSVVVADDFDWGDDRPPRRPMQDSIFYEAHIKGLTELEPLVPEALRGTYLGAAQPAVVQRLIDLGITALELLPVHAIADDRQLLERGLVNYWGYNSLNFFSLAPRYAADRNDPLAAVREFKELVRAMHRSGIEVILDVVYNHTVEGNHLGPTLSFRGLDNMGYYRTEENRRDRYVDYAGTGNTLDLRRPMVIKLVMDSLRYWVEEMHVDGFRFDLAPALARESDLYDAGSGFLDAVRQDPVLERVKLIAEPWDVGPHGYQAGSFPIGWTEWNGEYRDTVRRFWRGDEGVLGALASRIAGSADMFRISGRSAATSVNFVTAHDGYTLADLVSFEHKHNEENGEDNRDGHDYNFSANYGVEGPTEIPEIIAVRDRQRRNLLATLFLSLGTPMLLAGDEIGRTQRGNNNAYCQDNAVSWIDWTIDEREHDLLAFVRRLVEIRAEHPVLRRKTFLDGVKQRPSGYKDITWFAPSGHEMRLVDWSRPGAHGLAYRLGGDAIDDLDATTGNRIEGHTLLIVMNAGMEAIDFHLPRVPHRVGAAWRMLIDTKHPRGEPQHAILSGGVSLPLDARSMVVMRQLTWDETARAHSRVGGVLEASHRRRAALA